MGGKDVKRLSTILVIACVCVLCASHLDARDTAKPGLRVIRESPREEFPDFADPGLRGLYEEAAVDTYCLVWYDFETLNWQGWTRLDNTAQRGTFFHVDDFAGLGGGDFGGLVPLEGTKSMWCGVRPNSADPYKCSWKKAPGYGNGWGQNLGTNGLYFAGLIYLSYKCHYDTEPDYDFMSVKYLRHASEWYTAEKYTGRGNATARVMLWTTQARTKIRFNFTSDGAWSDEDGLWNTDGGCILDSIRVTDSGGTLSNYENFEEAPVGATQAGIWVAYPDNAFGHYSGLRSNLIDKDPCGDDLTSLIVFFIGSPNPSSSYPGLYDTPFCAGPTGHEAPCQDELVVSPPIDTRRYSTARNSVQDGVIPSGELPSLAGFMFRFAYYDDLPFANLVFYQWHVRNILHGCPGEWLDFNSIGWDDQGWVFSGYDVSSLITSDTVQVALGVVDMCAVWYLVQGDCAQHTPAPWFDNVRLYRYNAAGPQWSYRDLDLFQDNFPGLEFDIESYVRADAANDINTNDNPIIRPGDSIVVGCSSPLGGGIAADPTFGGPAVYLHVKCTYIGLAPVKPNLYGPTLAGSSVPGTSPPVTVSYRYVSDDGTWTIIQCDTARTSAGIVADKYCVDLNDELFTRGYEIDYYFTARDVAGQVRSLPKWAGTQGPYFEWTCLPTKNSTVLFVDDSRYSSFWSGTRVYWDRAWDALQAGDDPPDRYDINSPTSGVSNGPGSRAKNYQLTSQYDVIVWDSGDNYWVTISDGTTSSDRSNDCQMLVDWMDLSEHRCGLWICGDEIAQDLNGYASTSARTLLNTKCGVTLVDFSYYDLTGGRRGGGVTSPLITGDADAGVFVHGGVPDKFYAFGGCPTINMFGALGKTANGKWALDYPLYNGTKYYAGISSAWQNGAGADVRTMWFSFGFQYIRDAAGDMLPVRVELAHDVFTWMAIGCNEPGCDERLSPADVPSAYRLAQNFPNPFNPSTTIKYDMKEKGLVTLKIYNVAGQLVRTLLNGVRDAGTYSLAWDGRNNLGTAVASGIYFYKMETREFSATKKMVILR